MAGVNKITRSVAPKSMFESAQAVISSAVSFEQGDLLVFDDATNLLKVPTLESQGSTFLGIAKVTIVSGKLAGPYTGTAVDAASAISDIPGPVYGVIAKVIAKTGDAFNPGDSVYLDPASGTRNVQAAGTKVIGLYQGAAVASASAGQEIEVLLGCRHPGDSLNF
jgi:hypothetical protein